MNLFKWFKKKPQPEFRLGLALGSGGAKGFAELGALYALEQNGIEFDIVAGTSIGSIIGAFYAAGYSSTDISELLKSVDVSEIKNFFMIKMDTLGLMKVIDRTIGDLDIEELKKPFKAVATELDTGKEYVFDKGNVATALAASSSYPPFFKPVSVGGVKLIDGAFTNSVPADLVRGMGADYVVGIDLSSHVKSGGGILSAIFPEFDGGVEEPWQKGYENSDVMLHPDLSEYKAVSFAAGNKMYEIGYECAMKRISEIKAGIAAVKAKKGIKVKK
ncbi:MAG: patatin-like phospholipase family protein [Clostridia bacterium]|nr:patatin-like phospholipase family protein [Clostridia bacterium]